MAEPQYEIDLGNLMAFDPHHQFVSSSSSRLSFPLSFSSPVNFLRSWFLFGFLLLKYVCCCWDSGTCFSFVTRLYCYAMILRQGWGCKGSHWTGDQISSSSCRCSFQFAFNGRPRWPYCQVARTYYEIAQRKAGKLFVCWRILICCKLFRILFRFLCNCTTQISSFYLVCSYQSQDLQQSGKHLLKRKVCLCLYHNRIYTYAYIYIVYFW